MNKEKIVETSVGKFTIMKPKAGKRNRAIIACETVEGIKQATLLISLLPSCINSRPESFDQTVRIEHVLDDLESEDYDLLVDALRELLENSKSVETEEEKKT